MQAWLLLLALAVGFLDIEFGRGERGWGRQPASPVADAGTVQAMDGTDPQPPPPKP